MNHPVDLMRPVDPGEVVREYFLLPCGLSVNALSFALGVPATRIDEIVKERRGISADTAARLAKHFRGDAASLQVLQTNPVLKPLASWKEIDRHVHVHVHVHAREVLAA